MLTPIVHNPPGPRAGGRAALPLTWSIVETMDILEDGGLMKYIRESMADMQAGRVVPWKPENPQNTTSV